MEQIEYDGMVWSVENLTGLRQEVIRIRDEALSNTDFDKAVPLSHVIAILHHVIEDAKQTEAA